MTSPELSEPHPAEANRSHWNDRTDVHLSSAYYDLEGFRRDGPRPIFGPDEDEVGPVAGLRLLHLQCHVGLDSLRWAALGAEVTGVDISDRSAAQRSESGIAARFLRCDVHDLPELAELQDEQFDLVYASGGAICWIADLVRWATIAARFVRPCGFLYLSDGHPMTLVLDGAIGYFERGATRFEDTISYAYGDNTIAHPVNYRWHHTLGDVVTAVAAAGLRIDFLHEHPWSPRQRSPVMIQDADGRWHLPGDPHPQGFSLRAMRHLHGHEH